MNAHDSNVYASAHKRYLALCRRARRQRPRMAKAIKLAVIADLEHSRKFLEQLKSK